MPNPNTQSSMPEKAGTKACMEMKRRMKTCILLCMSVVGQISKMNGSDLIRSTFVFLPDQILYINVPDSQTIKTCENITAKRSNRKWHSAQIKPLLWTSKRHLSTYADCKSIMSRVRRWRAGRDRQDQKQENLTEQVCWLTGYTVDINCIWMPSVPP